LILSQFLSPSARFILRLITLSAFRAQSLHGQILRQYAHFIREARFADDMNRPNRKTNQARVIFLFRLLRALCLARVVLLVRDPFRIVS
jgi:hypothetical protein